MQITITGQKHSIEPELAIGQEVCDFFRYKNQTPDFELYFDDRLGTADRIIVDVVFIPSGQQDAEFEPIDIFHCVVRGYNNWCLVKGTKALVVEFDHN